MINKLKRLFNSYIALGAFQGQDRPKETRDT
jgi:hypothetical protein